MNKIIVLLCLMSWAACRKPAPKPVPLIFKNVLVFGNSITKHAPRLDVGWYGNWGMAASSEEKDFSHIIGSRLKAQVKPVNIGEFELNHRTFELNKLDEYFTAKPDLVVIKIGENVLDPIDFDKSFNRFITYIKEKAPNAKIIIAGTFWQNVPVNQVLIKEASVRKIPFVKLMQFDTAINKSFIGEESLAVDGSKYKISNQDVANHPGDVGMKNIAEAILAKVDSLARN